MGARFINTKKRWNTARTGGKRAGGGEEKKKQENPLHGAKGFPRECYERYDKRDLG